MQFFLHKKKKKTQPQSVRSKNLNFQLSKKFIKNFSTVIVPTKFHKKNKFNHLHNRKEKFIF